ncbi:UPF0481 protein At3g47200-like [Ananas comosus]|uniref:UPF0481 protein At3g47200-like n=2 Tax=Ananas comosus TaxID=4615 RepID=A0A6P5G015_ANACO|nr:UPF0481 protein At3g47200-like [Ananas comosus]XP_020098581.1 UPF0481 protein At3g47200-like [Ananas comosus]XP_020098582.1 UPF0481 protein At3g47200-like [Ananas comosus]XP_020098583.1 UPF0481 protein At3g47200-like [Ananas comosus]
MMIEGGCCNSQLLKIVIRESEPREESFRIKDGETNLSRIFKVPDQIIREVGLLSFQPKILSIGPYHHGSSHLSGMEMVKLICRHYILGLISENYYDRDEIKGIEKKARSFYGENITMEPNKFAEMLLLDGCFILAALTGMKGKEAVENVSSETSLGDLKQHEALNRHDIVHDLLLEENQIPFFVLEEIHKLAAGKGETTESLKEKIATYVKGVLRYYPTAIEISEIRWKDFHHLLHLCHIFFRPSQKPVKHNHNQAMIQCSDCVPRSHHVTNQWRRAVHYHKAGVKFKVKESRTPHSLLDVTFSNGIMIIPHLSIDAKTESIFSNLIMFERGCPHVGKYINAYVTFMSQLLSDADDVELLVRRGIIEILGREEEILNVFSRLNGLAVFDPHGEDYYLKSMLQSIEDYYRCRRNRWMAWSKHYLVL